MKLYMYTMQLTLWSTLVCGWRGRGLGGKLTEGVYVGSWEVVGDWPSSPGFKVFGPQGVCAED